MGLPFVAISLAAVIMLSDLGIDEARITFWTSLLLLPYTIKPLWSPLLELYFTKKAFALGCQMLTAICFGLMAFLLPVPGFFAYTIALMAVIAFCGATNDIATDGIYLTTIDKTTQARYIGWQGAFYNLAKVLVNGGLVYLSGMLIRHFEATSPHRAAVYAWMIIMGIIAATMLGVQIYHYFFLPTGSANEESPRDFRSAMVSLFDVFRDFFTKRHIWLYIVFIVCYRLTEGFAIKMVPLFLKAPVEAGGLGLSNESIGLIYGTFGTVAFIAGSIAGGYFIAHFTLRKTIFFACVHIQHSICHLCGHGPFSTRQSAAGRRGPGDRVFLLRIRLRGPHPVHDAAGGTRTTPHGTLRIRIGHHESRLHASGHDQRICVSACRLRNFFHDSARHVAAIVYSGGDNAFHP